MYVNGVERTKLPLDLQRAQNKQMKTLVLTTVFVFACSIGVMLYYTIKFHYTSCSVEDQFPPIWIYPLSSKYLAQLDAAHVPAEQGCLLVSILSTATTIWCIALIFQFIWSLFQKITVSIPRLLMYLIILELIIPMGFIFGLSPFKTLFGPSIDKSITMNCIIILSIMAPTFMIAMWIVDQLIAYLKYRVTPITTEVSDDGR